MATPQAATAPQLTYLRNLVRTRLVFGSDMSPAASMARAEEMIAAGLTKDEATGLLDNWSRAPRYPDNLMPVEEARKDWLREQATLRALFGPAVPPKDTIARVEEAVSSPTFSVADFRPLQRLAYNAPLHPTAQTPLRLSDIEGIDGLSISEGHYAVFDSGDVLRFYRIYSPATGENKGIAVIRRIAGDNLMGLYPDEARHVLTTINADPDAAAYRFADTFTKCWVCAKNLTDAVSRLLSVGPTCRGFANHTGLRMAASQVDHDPARREVFRALRAWALDNGFTDPRSKEDRTKTTMSASRVASAWSGIPGVLGMDTDQAVATATQAISGGALSEEVQAGLRSGPADTLLILIESKVLSAPVLQQLVAHPKPQVRQAANEFFLAALTNPV